MIKIFEYKNLIYNKIVEWLKDSSISNSRFQHINVMKEFYEDIDKDSCPVVVIQQGPFSYIKFELDQFSFSYPTAFDLQILVIDYSVTSFTSADHEVESILSNTLELLSSKIEENFSDILKRVEVQSIQYGVGEVKTDLYFSNIRAILVFYLNDF